MTYFFILGSNPALSAAEIIALAERRRIGARVRHLSGEAMVLEAESKIDAEEWLSRLGGTVKMGAVLSDFSELDADALAGMLSERKRPAGEKIYFGFSLHRLEEGISGRELKKTAACLKKLGIETKRLLKEKGISSRFVTSRERFLSSVIVRKNKLLTQGSEIVFLSGRGKTYAGETLAVQEFEKYGQRDYGRPARDMKVGMLPPKLAKIMINLADIGQNQAVLDPFCGLGTVLQEAILMGCQNVIGSDISEKAVEMTKENLEWLISKFKIQDSRFKIIQADIRKISEQLPPSSIDAIVTEPYLGPPLQGNEPEAKIRETVAELSKLYLAAFSQFKKILAENGRIAIVFPAFDAPSPKSQAHGRIFLPILEEIRKMGFETKSFFPEELGNNPIATATARGSLIYSRPGQKVLREIFIFGKK